MLGCSVLFGLNESLRTCTGTRQKVKNKRDSGLLANEHNGIRARVIQQHIARQLKHSNQFVYNDPT